MPNLQPIPFGTDPSQQLAAINANFGEINAESTTKLFYDTAGVPSISIGVQPDRTTAIKVAKAGYSVITATNAQLAFNSAQNVFKVVSSGSATMTLAANANTYGTIAHGLSYIPVIVAYLEAGLAAGARTPLPTWTSLTRDDANARVTFGCWVNAEVDSTNVYVRAFNATASAVSNITVTYYLLQETVSL